MGNGNLITFIRYHRCKKYNVKEYGKMFRKNVGIFLMSRYLIFTLRLDKKLTHLSSRVTSAWVTLVTWVALNSINTIFQPMKL